MNISTMQFWFLDSFWKYPASARFLYGSCLSLSEQFNQSVPPHTMGDRINALITLVELNLLSAQLGAEANALDAGSVESLLNDRYDSLDRPLRFSITPFGGTVWERIAMPNWQRYFEDQPVDPAGRDIEDGGNRETRVFMASCNKRLDEVIEFRMRFEIFRFVESRILERGVIRPWQISGWKSLPEAHWIKVSYLVRPELFLKVGVPDARLLSQHHCWQGLGFHKLCCQSTIDNMEWGAELNLCR